MKCFLIILAICTGISNVRAQCAFNASLSGTGTCLGDTLHITAAPNSILQIVWYKGSTVVKTVKAANTGVTVAGGNGPGAGKNQFIDPTSVYVDGAGNIYVTDRGNNRVQKWAPGAVTGTTVAGGNGVGPGPNQLYYPCDAFVDGSGNVFVSDQNNQRVQEWKSGTATGLTVAGGNGYGIGSKQFLQPWGVFIDGSGYLYVVDEGANRVQKFPPGSTSATDGVTVAGGASGIGSPGSQLANPVGIFVDGSGNMYITDDGNSRIQKWQPGATTGTTVAGGNGPGSNANQFDGIAGIYVDGGGNIYVADQNNNRIQKWPPGATTGITVAGGFGYGSGSSPGELSAPSDVWVDGSGNIYIADYANARIQKWSQQPVADTSYIPVVPGTYTAVVTGVSGCSVTTNVITITAAQKPAITISTPSSTICTGSPVNFTAITENAGTSPAYQWELNGSTVGTNQPAYTNSTLANGDKINCVLSANTGCGTAFSSDTITMQVNLPPVITMEPDIQLFQGGSAKLAPLVSGVVAGYQWLPPAGLDDATIANPVARPSQTTKYTLTVTAAGGCTATGSITVKVLTDLIVPNAFSPNGDGINDTWNINSLSNDYPNCSVDVFNRYGQPVFHSEGYTKAWDGTYNKTPLPIGTYYYIIDLKNGSGKMSGSLTIVR